MDNVVLAQNMENFLHGNKQKQTAMAKELATFKKERANAYDEMRALDHTLQLIGLGLAKFIPVTTQEARSRWSSKEPHPLQPEEALAYVENPEWGFKIPEGMHSERSAIFNTTTQQQRWELLETRSMALVLGVVGDEGGKLFSAVWFLQLHLGARVCWLGDPQHRMWNDFKDAITGMHWKETLYDALIVMNVRHGPWKSTSFWHQLRTACEERLGDIFSESGMMFFWRSSSKLKVGS